MIANENLRKQLKILTMAN